LTTLLTGLSW